MQTGNTGVYGELPCLAQSCLGRPGEACAVLCGDVGKPVIRIAACQLPQGINGIGNAANGVNNGAPSKAQRQRVSWGKGEQQDERALADKPK